MNYYNEYEPFAAEWLKELIKDGLIPDGEVDTRSIVDVEPEDLKDFNQCHFFAGIGGWAYAARLAGWGDDRPMWTGSPPCQPFSTAGKQDGASDERHLWPVWFNLLRECRPPIVFGEQVSAAITFGWLDQLQADLESSDYSCGAIIVPASGVGALHRRDRLWFVADRMREGLQGSNPWGQDTKWRLEHGHPRRSSSTGISGRMAYSECRGCQSRNAQPSVQLGDLRCQDSQPIYCRDGMADYNDIGHQWNQKARRETERRAEHSSNGCFWTVGDTEHSGSHGSEERRGNEEAGSGSAEGQHISLQSQGASGCSESGDICGHSFWNAVQGVQCKDGKVRAIPTEPEIFPLADGIPNRVGTLRGAGNAIVPQVAAEIIGVFL